MGTKIKPSHFFITLFLLFLASMAIHEYSHLAVLLVFGGEGHIYFNSVIVTKYPQTTIGYFLTALMGGIGTSLFFLLLRIIEEDPEDKIVMSIIAIFHFAYGTLEGLASVSISYAGYSLLFIIPITIYLVYRFVLPHDGKTKVRFPWKTRARKS